MARVQRNITILLLQEREKEREDASFSRSALFDPVAFAISVRETVGCRSKFTRVTASCSRYHTRFTHAAELCHTRMVTKPRVIVCETRALCGIIETGAGMSKEANVSRPLFDYSREKIVNALINSESVCVALHGLGKCLRFVWYIYTYIYDGNFLAPLFYLIFKLCQARYFLSRLIHEKFINILVKDRQVVCVYVCIYIFLLFIKIVII